MIYLLEELSQAIGRMLLNEPNPEIPHDQLQVLVRWCRSMTEDLSVIYNTKPPHIKRIHMEELAELIWDFPKVYQLKGECKKLQEKIWRYYRLSTKNELVYDEYYLRYQQVCEKIKVIWEHPYSRECTSSDYKSQRYEYASSKLFVPDWVMESSTIDFLEELVTAALFAWYCSRDWYFENLIQRKGA